MPDIDAPPHECTCGGHQPLAVNAAAGMSKLVQYMHETWATNAGFVPTAPLATDAQRAQLNRRPEWEGFGVIEGIPTGDRRVVDPGALSVRDLPLPLSYLNRSANSHEGAVLSGLITRAEKHGPGMWTAGVFDSTEAGAEHRRQVESGMQPWVSVDLDEVTSVFAEDRRSDPIYVPELEAFVYPMMQHLVSARVMGQTGCLHPAMQQAKISIIPQDPVPAAIAADGSPSKLLPTISSTGRYTIEIPLSMIEPGVLSADASGPFPVVPPAVWFQDPKLDRPTHLFVTTKGQVFGHIAVWNQPDGSPSCHIGYAGGCVKPPHSMTNYAKFANKAFHTVGPNGEEGNVERTGIIYCPQVVGQLNHPPAHLTDTAQLEFFGKYGAGAAQVRVGEDEFGIWAAGAMRSTATMEMAQQLTGGDVSGHWIFGELRAITAVDQGGFDVPGIEFTLAADGSVASLVGAGKLPVSAGPVPISTVAELARRVEALERIAGPGRKATMDALLDEVFA